MAWDEASAVYNATENKYGGQNEVNPLQNGQAKIFDSNLWNCEIENFPDFFRQLTTEIHSAASIFIF